MILLVNVRLRSRLFQVQPQLVAQVQYAGWSADTLLWHNRTRLLDAAGLTAEKRREAVALFSTKVSTVPGTEA